MKLYADDVQAYLHCLASDAMAAIQAMTLATGALVVWMSLNRLRLNPSRTKYIWLGTRQQLAKLDLAAMAVSFSHIDFSLTLRDLGLTLDQQLTFATTSCVSYVSSLALSLPLLLILLSTPLSHLDFFARTSTTQARAFSEVGPSVWNGLPLSQPLLPRILSDTFSLASKLFFLACKGRERF